jgi:enoyl-CoA hydratase
MRRTTFGGPRSLAKFEQDLVLVERLSAIGKQRRFRWSPDHPGRIAFGIGKITDTAMNSVRIEFDQHVGIVTLDRPPVNALDRATYYEIAAAFRSVASDRNVRAVILTGAGAKAFSAGADLKAMSGGAANESPTDTLDRGHAIRSALTSIQDCPVPVVCAVNAAAIGAGTGLASMCDIIISAEDAKFGFPEINVGLLGGIAHLTMMLGRYRARAMYLTGEMMEAKELCALGFIYRVVAREQLMSEALKVAADIANKSPIAIRLAKEALNRIDGLPVMDAYRVEQDYTNRLLRFNDATEARNAILEKRPPNWTWT